MISQHVSRGLLIVVVAALLFILVGPAAFAFEARGGDNVVIPAGEVVDDDLYVAAGTFTLDGEVTGDLVVGGGTITINGKVGGDLMAAGQSVIIAGNVADDARLGGAAITLIGQVADDLVGAGWSLETRTGSSVGGALVFAGQQALLAGAVTGDVQAAVAGLRLAGSVGGNVDAEVGVPSDISPISPFMFMPNAPTFPTVPGGLTIEGAKIGGTLKYTSPQEYQTPEGVKTEYTPRTEMAVPEAAPKAQPTLVDRLLNLLRNFIALLLVGLLLIWVASRWLQPITEALAAKPLPSLGWGLFVFVAVLVLAPLLLILTIALAVFFGWLTLGKLSGLVLLVGGLAFALAITAFILIVSWLSRIVVSMWLGRLILQRLSPALAAHRFWPFVLGLLILAVLMAIPYIGWLIGFLAALFGLGAVWLWLRRTSTPSEVAIAKTDQ